MEIVVYQFNQFLLNCYLAQGAPEIIVMVTHKTTTESRL